MSRPTTPASPRWRLILNGKSAGNEAVREAVFGLRARGVKVEVRVTWESGDAARYAGEAVADGIDTIVAGGGDGTLSEIAGALARSTGDADALPSLALLPLGTANDFAMAAGIPLDPEEALELARRRPAAAIDLLRIDAGDGERTQEPPREYWCANLASGGFGTQVTVETDAGLKRVLGGLAYLVTGIARLGRIEPIEASIRGPDFAWQGGFIALGIGNGRQAGGGHVLCPDAVVDDDLLDLTIVPDLGEDTAATLASVLTAGREQALERVAVRTRLPWLEIDAPKALTLNLDGEPCAAHRFHVDCVAHRLRMHLPQDCPLRSSPDVPRRQ